MKSDLTLWTYDQHNRWQKPGPWRIQSGKWRCSDVINYGFSNFLLYRVQY